MKKKLTVKKRTIQVIDSERLGDVAGAGNTAWYSVCGPICSNNICASDNENASCNDTCGGTCDASCGGTCDSCTCDVSCGGSCGDSCGASCGTDCGLCQSENNFGCG